MSRVDWTNLEAVKAYARKLGPGQVVIWHIGRKNYNITHASHRDRWGAPGVLVMYRT